ncbi:MAG: alpha-galactosidase, partial [Isosphaeraceae bacterium]
MNRDVEQRHVVAAVQLIMAGVAAVFALACRSDAAEAAATTPMPSFLARVGIGPNANAKVLTAPVVLSAAKQDYRQLTADACCHTLTPITIGATHYRKGLGMHANGHATFLLNASFARFRALVGVDNNSDTQGTRGSVEFLVKVDGQEVAKTPICRGGESPRRIDVPLDGAKALELITTDSGDGYSYDQADWADAHLIDQSRKTFYLSDAAGLATDNGFLTQQRLPASFVYGGQSSRQLLGIWPRENRPPVDVADRTVYETVWREPGNGLIATWRAEVFKNWPAMEVRWYFANEGNAPTKPLTKVLALDLEAAVNDVSLVHCSGGLTGGMQAADLGFAVSETPLGAWTLSGAGGRSSDRDLPFFLVHRGYPTEGLFVGVGWSGDWQAHIEQSGAKPTLHLTALMPGVHLALHTGQHIITPSILLGAYRGPWTTGANLLRRMLYEKYVPRLAGSRPLPPVSWNSWFMFENRISEAMLKTQANAAADAGIEYFCIDAGWFDGDFPNGVGNWTINTKKFPRGLKPIGQYVKDKGMKLGLWFEPERVASGTRLPREHPDWVHGDLLDLGKPEACRWVFEMMKQYIDEGEVRWIRFDFNTSPLGTWNRMDPPDQRGLAQIRHLNGLYGLLDRLRAAYPNLLIEGCASGGRRIDLETIRRAHTFWKSDETANLPVLRFHQTGGNVFLPSQLLNTNVLPEHLPYDLASIFGGPLGFRCDWTKMSTGTRQQIKSLIAAYKTVRPLLGGEYYALFPQRR